MLDFVFKLKRLKEVLKKWTRKFSVVFPQKRTQLLTKIALLDQMAEAVFTTSFQHTHTHTHTKLMKAELI